MSRQPLRAAAAGVVALLAGLLAAPSAQADIQTFPDVGGHITGVRVSHGPATVGITAYDADISFRDYYHFWVDTNSSNPGPEYKAEIYPDSDILTLKRVANFDSSGIRFSCEGFYGFAESESDFVKIVIPRACISIPPTVRVAVVGYYDEDSDPAVDVTDWAPGERRFYPWVNR